MDHIIHVSNLIAKCRYVRILDIEVNKVAKLTLAYGHNVLDIVNIEVQCENSL